MRSQPSGQFVSSAFRPILWAWCKGPEWLQTAIFEYAAFENGTIRFGYSGGEQSAVSFEQDLRLDLTRSVETKSVPVIGFPPSSRRRIIAVMKIRRFLLIEVRPARGHEVRSKP